MSNIKLFSLEGEAVQELRGSAVTLEKSLQGVMEQNLEAMLGIRFLANEYSTGGIHRWRIDTLGIDENECPVIIEYKRSTNSNIISQGLSYLHWLLNHKAEFKCLVSDKLGQDHTGRIDWTSPRLLCIAEGFTRYDEHAIREIEHNIELIRYRKFWKNLLLLELVNAKTVERNRSSGNDSEGENIGNGPANTFSERLKNAPESVQNLYEELRTYLLALGDDVQEKMLKNYMAFRNLRNFACVQVFPKKQCVKVYLNVDLDTERLEDDFTRDIREDRHFFGRASLEVTMYNRKDLQKAEHLIQQSYEAS